VFNGWAELELAGGFMFICDVEDLDIVESHTWYCMGNGYVATHTDAHTQQFFHNMVINHIPNLGWLHGKMKRASVVAGHLL